MYLYFLLLHSLLQGRWWRWVDLAGQRTHSLHSKNYENHFFDYENYSSHSTRRLFAFQFRSKEAAVESKRWTGHNLYTQMFFADVLLVAIASLPLIVVLVVSDYISIRIQIIKKYAKLCSSGIRIIQLNVELKVRSKFKLIAV